MSDNPAQDALTWLAFALGDLESARSQPGRSQRPRIVAFHAQQAVEKALKAALVLADIDPPRTHDLNALRNGLPSGWRVRTRHPDLGSLSRLAVDTRSPDDLAPVTPIQAATAVRQAAAVVRSIREDFARRGLDTSGLKPE